MKKNIIIGSLLCSVFAFSQEKEAKRTNGLTPSIVESLKPLVMIAEKEHSLQDLYEIDEKTIEKIIILKPDEGRAIYGQKGNNGVIVVRLKKDSKPFVSKRMLYIVEGKKMREDMVLSMDFNRIESINIFKNEEAIKQYGEEAKNGVIIIKLKEEK